MGETTQEEGWVVCRLFKKKNHHKTLDNPISTSRTTEARTQNYDSFSGGALKPILQHMGNTGKEENEAKHSPIFHPLVDTCTKNGFHEEFMKLPSLESSNSTVSQNYYHPINPAMITANEGLVTNQANLIQLTSDLFSTCEKSIFTVREDHLIPYAYLIFGYDRSVLSYLNIHSISQLPNTVVGSIIKQSEFSEFWRILHLIWTPNVDGRTHSTECPFTRAQCMLLLGQQTRIDFSLYMFELIMDEAWEIKEYSLPYGVFLTQFLISRGVVIAASDTRKEVKSALNKFTLSRSRGQEGALTRRFARRAAAEEASRLRHQRQRHLWRREHLQCLLHGWPSYLRTSTAVSATVKATLQPVERQMQSLEEQLKELRTAFDGECTVTMLRNKSVVAHMADVNEQLEEIKKTLDDFKTEADP
ncbi:NAC domain-containing protein 43 [Morella rubra]|uniref:NAC domain-containing protein 43 n=1 Tax=Morella rubra TaxID=262757 RepID=A0A6A1W4G7_9ROSI|nr:NAC domain-containing protein 43 [Morella rubra]